MQAFTARLEAALAEAKIERPPDELYNTVKSVALFVYETSQPPFPDKNPPSFSDFRARMERCRAQMEKFDALLIVEACVQSMLAFLKPIRWDQDGFLRVPLHKAVPLGATVRDMVMPFYERPVIS